MGTRPGVAMGTGVTAPEAETDLLPLRVVETPEAGGWTVVNLETLKVVEPGYVWPAARPRCRWAREELERERQEELEYLRRRNGKGNGGPAQ